MSTIFNGTDSQTETNEFKEEIKVKIQNLVTENSEIFVKNVEESSDGKTTAITAKEVAKEKLGSLERRVPDKPLIPENLAKDLVDFSALGVASKAIRASFNDEIEEKYGKIEKNQANFGKVSNYQRHERTSFKNIDFQDAFMNSFANCEFDGACTFSNLAANKVKFTNCTFGDNCTVEKAVEQAKQLMNLNPNNISGCKFSETFINGLEEIERKTFKSALNIKKEANGGYYESEAKEPTPITKITNSFKFKSTISDLTK